MSEFDYRQYLLDLLAVIHRDGGHYTAKHGIDKSCADAEKIVSSVIQKQALTEEEIFNVIRPLCANDTNCKAIIGVSIDEYRAIESAHGIK